MNATAARKTARKSSPKLVAVAPPAPVLAPLVDRLVAAKDAAETAERAYRLLAEEFLASRPEGSAELASDGRRVAHVAGSAGKPVADEGALRALCLDHGVRLPADPVAYMTDALAERGVAAPMKVTGARRASVRIA